MAWITIKGAYGEVRATCFAAGWKLIKGKVKIGDSVKYEVDARNILKEIMIDSEYIIHKDVSNLVYDSNMQCDSVFTSIKESVSNLMYIQSSRGICLTSITIG